MAQLLSQLLHELNLTRQMVFAGGPVYTVLTKIAANIRNMRKVLMMIPRTPFQECLAGPAPDYDKLESWVAHPSRGRGVHSIEDANHLSEAGDSPPPVDNRPCDCFFLVDSCLTPDVLIAFPSDASRWNAPLSGEYGSVEQRIAAKVLEQMQMRTAAGASCFNQTCRIFAPRYRQVSVLALVAYMRSLVPENGSPNEQNIKSAISLAYADVRQAFLHFLEETSNSNRPFFLAGHSQGSMLLIRLLQEEVENHPSRLCRFIHAYLPGFCVPMEIFGRTLNSVRPSTSASDAGSVSSWRTGAEGHHDLAHMMIEAVFLHGIGWQRVSRPEVLGNNPITWTAEAEGPPSDAGAHRGAFWPLPSNLDPRLYAGIIPSGVSLRLGHLSAACQDIIHVSVPNLVRIPCGEVRAQLDKSGMVRVPRLQNPLFKLTEQDFLLYHDLDIGLFHANIADNVALRSEAWRPRSKL